MAFHFAISVNATVSIISSFNEIKEMAFVRTDLVEIILSESAEILDEKCLSRCTSL
jgi:hypothetical protein